MPKTAPPSPKTGAAVSLSDLEYHVQDWLLDGKIRQWSARTPDSRRRLVDKLPWFLKHRNFASYGTRELRAFLAYVTTGHQDPERRWGNPTERRPVRPGTVVSYCNILRALFQFPVDEGVLEASPMGGLRPPIDSADQGHPFRRVDNGLGRNYFSDLEQICPEACATPRCSTECWGIGADFVYGTFAHCETRSAPFHEHSALQVVESGLAVEEQWNAQRLQNPD